MANNKYLINKEFYDSLSVSIKLSVLFILGIGNYRSILFLIIFFIVKALVESKEKIMLLQVLFAPILVVFAFLDYKNGQLWIVHNLNNIPLFLIGFIIVDHVLTMYINAFVEKISNGFVFSCCNNCRHENVKLTKICRECGYERSGNERRSVFDFAQAFSEDYYKQPILLRKRMEQCEVANLSLSDSEKIYMSIKVKVGTLPYKDDTKILCDTIVITNKNIIFIGKINFQRGWRWREKLQLKSITQINLISKKVSISERQVVQLSSDSHCYEFFLWSTREQNNKYLEHFQAVKQTILELKKYR